MLDAFSALLARVTPVDHALAAQATRRLDSLTKPKGSLGRLEELATRLFCIQQGPPRADPARIYVIAGDHGVAAEGVSPFPQAVTRQMVANFLTGGAGVNVLAGKTGTDLMVVDAGCLGGRFPDHPGLIQRKIASGTANLAQGPAMSREECLAALLLGAELADQAKREGFACLGTGDMGIANTTPSAALYCVMLGLDPAAAVGPGAGLDPDGVRRKVQVVRQAISANWSAVARGGEGEPCETCSLDGPDDPLAALAAVGGLEIAALAGLIIGAAANRLPVAVDGYISTAAAVAAWRLCPAVKDYCVFAHASAEPGHRPILARLGAEPLLDLGLRLGEGTGAALALFLLRCAAAIFSEMASFEEAGVSQAGD